LEYTYKSKSILKLPSCYVSNGKWNHVQLRWTSGVLYLDTGYELHSVSVAIAMSSTNVKLTAFGGSKNNKLTACVKGKIRTSFRCVINILIDTQ